MTNHTCIILQCALLFNTKMVRFYFFYMGGQVLNSKKNRKLKKQHDP